MKAGDRVKARMTNDEGIRSKVGVNGILIAPDFDRERTPAPAEYDRPAERWLVREDSGDRIWTYWIHEDDVQEPPPPPPPKIEALWQVIKAAQAIEQAGLPGLGVELLRLVVPPLAAAIGEEGGS